MTRIQTPPSDEKWNRNAVLSGMATYSDETLAELFWIGDKMERAKMKASRPPR